MTRARDDLNLSSQQRKSLQAIRRTALLISERAEGEEDVEGILAAGSQRGQRRSVSCVSRRRIASVTLPLTIDYYNVAIPLKHENIDEELGLQGDDRRVEPPSDEIFEW